MNENNNPVFIGVFYGEEAVTRLMEGSIDSVSHQENGRGDFIVLTDWSHQDSDGFDIYQSVCVCGV